MLNPPTTAATAIPVGLNDFFSIFAKFLEESVAPSEPFVKTPIAPVSVPIPFVTLPIVFILVPANFTKGPATAIKPPIFIMFSFSSSLKFSKPLTKSFTCSKTSLAIGNNFFPKSFVKFFVFAVSC